MTRWRWMMLAVALGCAVSVYMLLPEGPATLAPTGSATELPVRGAVHVHSRRSDGTGTVDEIAAAASRAGLKFVIFTDHGDATSGPERPSYRSGVLCIDAVEISTDGGHIVALDLPEAPYVLGGEARDVLEDVRRLGGFSIAAHPDSVRAELKWADWTAPFDGFEWLNGDSQWRDETWPALARALLTYPFRGAATLASLLDRPEALLRSWDSTTGQRRIALAGSDAHARLAVQSEPFRGRFALPLPSYEQVFRALSISLPDVRFSGTAPDDSRQVMEAIRRGHVYSTVDGLAGPAAVAFSATSGPHRATGGDTLPAGRSVEVRAEVNAPPGAQLVLFRDGTSVASSAPPVLVYTADQAAGTYRLEVQLNRAPGTPPVPWVLSNPIYVGFEPVSSEASQAQRSVSSVASLYGNGAASGWQVEKSPRSEGAINVVRGVEGTQLTLRFGLGGTQSEGPYVAAAKAMGPDVVRSDRVMFTARAAKPMRMSVQLRAPDETRDRRWRRSVYLDADPRMFTVMFDEMTPVGSGAGALTLSDVRDLLFVVDTVNTAPGSSGQVWLDDVRLAH